MEHGRIPNSLKKYRRIAGLSQKKVAAILQLPQACRLSRWEKGISVPSTEYLFRLSLLYKTLPNNLYFDLWQKLKHEAIVREEKMLTQEESFSSNEIYFL